MLEQLNGQPQSIQQVRTMNKPQLLLLAFMIATSGVSCQAADQTVQAKPPAEAAPTQDSSDKAPADAQKDSSAKSSPAKGARLLSQASPQSQGSSDSPLRSLLRGVAKAPVYLTSVAVTVPIGVPIAIVRGINKETKGVAAEMVGEADIPLGVAVVPFAGPFGVLAGTGDGFWGGIANSLKHSYDKPFGKEAFSLGEKPY